MGYGTPTAIQAQAIPVVMAGYDVIGLAKTGMRCDLCVYGLCVADCVNGEWLVMLGARESRVTRISF